MFEPSDGKRNERGFILIVVLLLAALLALIAVGFTRSAQSFIRISAQGIDSARAEALADSGVTFAVLDLITRRQGAGRNGRFGVDGEPSTCSAGEDGVVEIRVQDTGGRINLNLANEALLRALFVGLGAESEQAARYADTILDFRDRDDDRRLYGAELPEYRAAGRALGPKNAPFDTLEELDQVLGLAPGMIAAMRPHVTIHSASAGLDPRAVRPELVELLRRGRSEGVFVPSQFNARGSGLPAEFVISSDQRNFVVRSEARLASGAVFVRDAVIELPASAAASYRIRVWQRGTADAGRRGEAIDATAPPC